jgi:hypothetical protein
MHTTALTHLSLRDGTGLVIYESALAWYVVHEDAHQHYTAVPDARYDTYDAAHSRMQHERERRQAEA